MSDYGGGFGCGYIKLKPCDQQYESMATLGTAMRSVPYPKQGPNFKMQYDKQFQAFSKTHPESKLIYDLSDYERVRALHDNVEASIKKCDVSPKFPDTPCFWHAFDLVEEYLSPILTQEIGFDEESDFNVSTSAGFVYLQNNIKDKGEALESKIFEDLYSRDDFIPIASIADKDEFLSSEDLARNKVRTIFVDPVDKVAKCKFVFDKQNKAMLKNQQNNWIKYGFVKQYGGFDRLLKELEDPILDITDEGDISGYDRTILLYFVYLLRWKCLRYPRKWSERVFYVIFHTIFPTAVTPRGFVIMRQTGNNSGSNDTTIDNCISHLIVVFTLLCTKFYETHHRHLSLKELLQYSHYFIYSDDLIGGCHLQFFGWSSIEDYTKDKIEMYLKFGLVIKPSASLITLNTGRINPKHSFLGSFAYYDEFYEKYIPFPRIGKVCSSITRRGLNDQLSESEYFEKVLALTFLSFAHKEVFNVLLTYLKYMFENSTSGGAYRQIMYSNNLDFMYSSFLNMHLGWECKTPIPVVFKMSFFKYLFFFDNMVEVDLKAAMRSGNKIAAGKKMLAALIRERAISSEDAGYIVLSADPFHDSPQKCSGMPDATMADQITVQAPYQLSFGSPLDPDTPWSFHIVAFPWTTDAQGSAGIAGTYDLTGNWMKQKTSSTNVVNRMPSVSIYRGKDGDPLGPLDVDPSGIVPIGLGLAPEQTKGLGRLLGFGFEVYDTSAVVNKQGACTIYRQMVNATSEPFTWLTPNSGGPVASWGVFQGVKFFRPPSTVNEANQLLGTITHRGEDGCYVVLQQSTEDNNARIPTMAQPVLLTQDFSTGVIPTVAQTVLSGGFQQVAVGSAQNANIPLMRWGFVPYNMGGAFFTGLHPLATYTVKVRYVYERLPSVGETEISLFTSRATGYNPVAMEIRTIAQQMLPVGWPVSDNGLGETFWEFISDVGTSLASSINPILGGAAGIIRGVIGYKNRAAVKSMNTGGGPVITPPPPPPMPPKPFMPRKALPQGGPKGLPRRQREFSEELRSAAGAAALRRERNRNSQRNANRKAKRQKRREKRAANSGWEVVEERVVRPPRRRGGVY